MDVGMKYKLSRKSVSVLLCIYRRCKNSGKGNKNKLCYYYVVVKLKVPNSQQLSNRFSSHGFTVLCLNVAKPFSREILVLSFLIKKMSQFGLAVLPQ